MQESGKKAKGDVQYKLLPNFGTKLQMWTPSWNQAHYSHNRWKDVLCVLLARIGR